MSYIGSSPKVNRLRLNPRATDPVNPSEGDLQYADGSAREEGVWVYKNSAWVKVGSDQAGDINYITNGDAEAGSTAGWSLGNVTLTSAFPSGTPTFGSGANANLSFTNTTVTPLAGTRSFLYASSAATTAGNFVASDAFTVDLADRARVLQIAFNYQLVSGTANFSGTSSNSFGIAIYDVTAAQWIMPAGVWNLVQSSGVGRATATFQTSATSTQYRLVIFNANATSGAVSLELDRISVGPQSQLLAPAMSDWQAYTPTSNYTTAATVAGFWRRVGANIEVVAKISFSGATNNPGEPSISLPAGLSIDSSKLVATSGAIYAMLPGNGFMYDASVAQYYNLVPYAANSSSTSFFVGGLQSISTHTGTVYPVDVGVSNAIPVTIASGDAFVVTATLPVSGWSSNSVMSQDTDTRVVAAKLVGTTGAAYGTSGIVKVPYNTISFDTHSIVSTANSTITIPVSGYYKISGSILVGASGATINGNSEQYLDVYVDGAANARLGNYVNPTNGAQNGLNAAPQPRIGGSVELYLNAGQVVDLRFSGAFGATANFSNSSTRDFFSVERLSGPAVVAASETVAISYYNSVSQAVTANVTNFTYDTRNYDTHNAFSGGLFTAPVSGKYRVTSCEYNGGGSGQDIQLYKNGAKIQGMYRLVSAGGIASGSVELQLNAGDTLSIRSTGSYTRGAGSLFDNLLAISRFGN